MTFPHISPSVVQFIINWGLLIIVAAQQASIIYLNRSLRMLIATLKVVSDMHAQTWRMVTLVLGTSRR